MTLIFRSAQVVIALWLVLGVPLQAIVGQNSATPLPLAWPPDPELIFSPGVEIIEIREVIASQNGYSNVENTEPEYDNNTRTFRIYDPETKTWLDFAYPPQIEQVVLFYARDGQYLVATTYRSEHEIDPATTWLFDPITGSFFPPDLACGEFRARQGEGRWVVITDSFTTPVVICNTETTQEIILNVQEAVDSVWSTISPDDSRVLLFGMSNVFVYDVTTGDAFVLGEYQHLEVLDVEWLGDYHVLIRETNRADMTFPWVYYSLGNINEPNSLEPISVVYKPNGLSTQNNPQRYEWIDYREGGCVLMQITTEDGVISEYPQGNLCDLGIDLPQTQDRLYVNLHSESLSDEYYMLRLLSSGLVRFNPYTGERTDLISGEVERVMNISPDGRYAVVLLDDNGQIDLLTIDEAQNTVHSEGDDLNFRFVIINLETGEQVYEIPVTTYLNRFLTTPFLDQETGYIRSDNRDQAFNVPDADLFAIGNENFLLQLWDSFGYGGQRTFLLDISGSEISEQPIPSPILILPTGDQVLTLERSENPENLNLFDLQTGTLTPILLNATLSDRGNASLSVAGYWTYLSNSHSPHNIEIHIFNPDRSGNSFVYEVRLPEQ